MNTLATEDYEWMVTVTKPVPHCPSVEAAYKLLASPTTAKEWRSSDFAKIPVSLVDPATEPLKKGDQYIMNMPVGSFTSKILKCEISDESLEIEMFGSGMMGAIKNRVQVSVYKDNGEWMCCVKENPSVVLGLGFLVFKKDHMINEHETMIKEMDDSLVEILK